MTTIYATGEVIEFPCGCRGWYEEIGSEKRRLVIEVDPTCPFDAKKIGRVLTFVRYIGRMG